MKREKRKEMKEFLRANGLDNPLATLQLGLQFSNEAKASRYMFFESYWSFFASILGILALFIPLIVGENHVTMDDLNSIAKFIFIVMVYCTICYFLARLY